MRLNVSRHCGGACRKIEIAVEAFVFFFVGLSSLGFWTALGASREVIRVVSDGFVRFLLVVPFSLLFCDLSAFRGIAPGFWDVRVFLCYVLFYARAPSVADETFGCAEGPLGRVEF